MRKGKTNGQHQRVRQPTWYAKEWIGSKGLKQADIVERTGISKSLVSDYINGARRWNEDVLAAFAHAIGVERQDLLVPPHAIENELAIYVMKMGDRERARALRLIKAIASEDAA